jgi:hypothetical protein
VHLLGAPRTGGVDRYSLILSNASCCGAPKVNSDLFFKQSMGVKGIIFPDKYATNFLK